MTNKKPYRKRGSFFNVDKCELLTSIFIFLLTLNSILLIFSVGFYHMIGSDFVNYYVGATLVRNSDGHLLYEPEINYDLQKKLLGKVGLRNVNTFRPLPFVAFLLIPFTFFPIFSAFRIFSLFSLIALCFFILSATKVFKNIRKKSCFLFTLPFFFFPVLFCLRMGQSSVVLAFILLLIYKFVKDGKPFKTGALVALLLLKTQYIIFAPYIFLLSKNKKKFVLGLTLVFIFLVAVSIHASGLKQILLYPRFLASTENTGYGSKVHEFFTLSGLLERFPVFPRKPLIPVLINAFLYFFSLFVFYLRRKTVGLESAFLSATFFSIIFSMHVLAYDLCLLLVPIFILLEKISRKSELTVSPDLIVVLLLFLLPLLKYFSLSYLGSVFMLFLGVFFLDQNCFKFLTRKVANFVK